MMSSKALILVGCSMFLGDEARACPPHNPSPCNLEAKYSSGDSIPAQVCHNLCWNAQGDEGYWAADDGWCHCYYSGQCGCPVVSIEADAIAGINMMGTMLNGLPIPDGKVDMNMSVVTSPLRIDILATKSESSACPPHNPSPCNFETKSFGGDSIPAQVCHNLCWNAQGDDGYWAAEDGWCHCYYSGQCGCPVVSFEADAIAGINMNGTMLNGLPIPDGKVDMNMRVVTSPPGTDILATESASSTCPPHNPSPCNFETKYSSGDSIPAQVCHNLCWNAQGDEGYWVADDDWCHCYYSGQCGCPVVSIEADAIAGINMMGTMLNGLPIAAGKVDMNKTLVTGPLGTDIPATESASSACPPHNPSPCNFESKYSSGDSIPAQVCHNLCWNAQGDEGYWAADDGWCHCYYSGQCGCPVVTIEAHAIAGINMMGTMLNGLPIPDGKVDMNMTLVTSPLGTDILATGSASSSFVTMAAIAV